MTHPLTWLIWAVAAAIPALMVRNPFYLVIIGLCAWLVFVAARQGSNLDQSWRGLIRLGAFIWLLTIPFNALMIHQGRHILFRLPSHWPLVGGNITLEAVLYGTVSGLALWVLLLIFAALNAAIDTSQLLRLTPSFLYQAGIITSIALTFMPQMLLSAREIREAQRIRGHRFRGWRDLLPLFIPLLTTSFERAITLAESMESRGFGGQLVALPPERSNRMRMHILGGLVLLLFGLFAYGYWRDTPLLGIALLILAALLLLRVFATLGSSVQRSHYRRLRWSRADVYTGLLSLVVLAGTWVVRWQDRLALTYYPYPPFAMVPEFSVWIGLLLAMLAVPGIIALFQNPTELEPTTRANYVEEMS